MDIKEKIETAVAKISKDKNLQEQFQKDPVKTVESILGVEVPDEVIAGIKAKLAGDKLAGAASKLKGLF
ncbi:MAG: hypothetical protein LIO92_01850 [Clostridiales bacterium]|nr:hypothetical protein [Clostridiales bacterium]